MCRRIPEKLRWSLAALSVTSMMAGCANYRKAWVASYQAAQQELNGTAQPDRSTNTQKIKITEADLTNFQNTLLTAQKEGMLIRLDIDQEDNRAYVHPGIWQRLDSKTQQIFCGNVLIYLEMMREIKQGHDTVSPVNYKPVEIYDAFSGKRLVRWNNRSGFDK